MKILVINSGSSSLKYQLFTIEDGSVLAKGLCERIGTGGAITHKRPGKDDYSAEVPLNTHDDAIQLVLDLLVSEEYGVDPRRSASLLDIFSSVGQGLIPYGAQLLTAASIASISPFEIIPYMYYPILMAVSSLLFILCSKKIKA